LDYTVLENFPNIGNWNSKLARGSGGSHRRLDALSETVFRLFVQFRHEYTPGLVAMLDRTRQIFESIYGVKPDQVRTSIAVRSWQLTRRSNPGTPNYGSDAVE
jgi:hypothetical protein